MLVYRNMIDFLYTDCIVCNCTESVDSKSLCDFQNIRSYHQKKKKKKNSFTSSFLIYFFFLPYYRSKNGQNSVNGHPYVPPDLEEKLLTIRSQV